ncbi:MAG: endonuclease [Dethiosulfovibrio peptidovorans]|nr:MAG: endonuclease [Dethiosulfovibrio peptidovorans]
MYLAVDPGRFKFGWAVVDTAGSLRCSGIMEKDRYDVFFSIFSGTSTPALDEPPLEGTLNEVIEQDIRILFVGNGTGYRDFVEPGWSVPFKVVLVDEVGSTLEARKLYWHFHPPKGWWRLLPLSVQVPPRPIDDLAAYCIALRGMRKLAVLDYDKENEECPTRN